MNLCFCNITNVLPLAREGKLRALAVTSLQRSSAAPELPTMHEFGFPGFDATAWLGLMAPAGTPPAIQDKLHRQTVKALAAADLRAKFDAMGMVAIGGSPAEFAAVIDAEIPTGEGDQGDRAEAEVARWRRSVRPAAAGDRPKRARGDARHRTREWITSPS